MIGDQCIKWALTSRLSSLFRVDAYIEGRLSIETVAFIAVKRATIGSLRVFIILEQDLYLRASKKGAYRIVFISGIIN